jgi:hypothetical protein
MHMLAQCPEPVGGVLRQQLDTSNDGTRGIGAENGCGFAGPGSNVMVCLSISMMLDDPSDAGQRIEVRDSTALIVRSPGIASLVFNRHYNACISLPQCCTGQVASLPSLRQRPLRYLTNAMCSRRAISQSDAPGKYFAASTSSLSRS